MRSLYSKTVTIKVLHIVHVIKQQYAYTEYSQQEILPQTESDHVSLYFKPFNGFLFPLR